MDRISIINKIGNAFLTSNIENGEYSYPKVFRELSIPFVPITDDNGTKYEKLDIRIVKDGVAVLIETKQNFNKHQVFVWCKRCNINNFVFFKFYC